MRNSVWGVLGAGCLMAASAIALGDDDDRHGGWWSRVWHEARVDVAPVDNALYRDECGSCHLAYPPGLLPARSWQAVMNRLDRHFGENAELDATTAAEIVDYLDKRAADRSDYRRSRRFADSVPRDASVLRITETRYFQRKHDEIPRWVMQQGDRTLRFSQCDSCHTEAERGVFNEHTVHIPGLGRWED